MIATDMKKINNGIKEAIEVAGGQRELGDKIGVTQPTVHHYLHNKCPATKAVEIERETGVRRERIRPDLFDG